MKIAQRRWTDAGGWQECSGELGRERVDLVLVFGATDALKKEDVVAEIVKAYPDAHVLGCSTAGEICSSQVFDDSIAVTAIHFEHTKIKGTRVGIQGIEESFSAGERLAQSLSADGLVHTFVLSDGLKVNGSELVRGITANLPAGVTVTGGLAGDGSRFQETLVFWDDKPAVNEVAILGFYGDRLKVGYGSLGGWDPFGPERTITRSKGNILYELDNKSALEIYKQYLGEHAAGLPATGLLFPLNLRTGEAARPIVRTILAVDENEQSMTFAGDVPEGSYARLMKANFDRLIDGAVGAANTSYETIGSVSPDLAILISCVGRKLVLKQRVEEEVEGARDVLGESAAITGFYSYGEISPFVAGASCELHNQTMTITAFKEV